MALVAEHSAASSTHELQNGLLHDMFSMMEDKVTTQSFLLYKFQRHRCINVIIMDDLFPSFFLKLI